MPARRVSFCSGRTSSCWERRSTCPRAGGRAAMGWGGGRMAGRWGGGALDPLRAVAVIEDYKPLDVECAAVNLALLQTVRARYPEWRLLVDGDGGDENLKDYPIEANSELTIRSVVNNRMLYQEGWGVDSLKHSLTYSGGYSRGCVRGYACASRYGFG